MKNKLSIIAKMLAVCAIGSGSSQAYNIADQAYFRGERLAITLIPNEPLTNTLAMAKALLLSNESINIVNACSNALLDLRNANSEYIRKIISAGYLNMVIEYGYSRGISECQERSTVFSEMDTGYRWRISNFFQEQIAGRVSADADFINYRD